MSMREMVHVRHGTIAFDSSLRYSLTACLSFLEVGSIKRSNNARLTKIVKSLLNLCDLDESGLLLESKEGTKNTCLEGRSFRTRCANDETLYPGLPLFQAYPFEPSPEGENVTLKSLSCYFVNGDARGNRQCPVP